jgi:hypothetical protein
MSDNNLTPRIEQLAPELEKIISNLGADPAPCRWLRRDAGPGRGTAVVGGGRLPLVQRHPQQPSHEVPPGKRRFAVSFRRASAAAALNRFSAIRLVSAAARGHKARQRPHG